MRRHFHGWMGLPLLVLALAASAQVPMQTHIQMGQIHLDTGASDTVFLANHDTRTILSSGVVVKSPQYDIHADHATITTRPATVKGQSSLAHIVADGDPAHGTQVVGHLIDRNDPQRTYTVHADHAIYTPDDSRPQGGTIDLTGHPVVIVHDPQDFAVPAPFVAPHIVILLGPAADDYPRIKTDDLQGTITPLHQ